MCDALPLLTYDHPNFNHTLDSLPSIMTQLPWPSDVKEGPVGVGATCHLKGNHLTVESPYLVVKYKHGYQCVWLSAYITQFPLPTSFIACYAKLTELNFLLPTDFPVLMQPTSDEDGIDMRSIVVLRNTYAILDDIHDTSLTFQQRNGVFFVDTHKSAHDTLRFQEERENILTLLSTAFP